MQGLATERTIVPLFHPRSDHPPLRRLQIAVVDEPLVDLRDLPSVASEDADPLTRAAVVGVPFYRNQFSADHPLHDSRMSGAAAVVDHEDMPRLDEGGIILRLRRGDPGRADLRRVVPVGQNARRPEDRIGTPQLLRSALEAVVDERGAPGEAPLRRIEPDRLEVLVDLRSPVGAERLLHHPQIPRGELQRLLQQRRVRVRLVADRDALRAEEPGPGDRPHLAIHLQRLAVRVGETDLEELDGVLGGVAEAAVDVDRPAAGLVEPLLEGADDLASLEILLDDPTGVGKPCGSASRRHGARKIRHIGSCGMV